MRKWKVETVQIVEETSPPLVKMSQETIEADEICTDGQYVIFYVYSSSETCGGSRAKAVRMNANVTEITEEEK